jgi:hypothetical protein
MDETFELVITKTELGYTVYDNVTKNRIDIFPCTKQGTKDLLEFVENFLGNQDKSPPNLKIVN